VHLRNLHSVPFLREIHHFLWTEPSTVAGTDDAGWSCRDHAWVTAFLAKSLGHKPLLFHGEAHFVKGPSGASGSVSLRQAPHSWVLIEGVGAVDLSTRADWIISGHPYRIPITCIFADAWIPRRKGSAFFLDDADEYERAVEDLHKRRNETTAIYRTDEAEHVHAGQVTRAAGWIRSPLTVRLDALYGNPSDLYCALVLHLRAVLEGRADSLTTLPPAQAWATLAQTRSGAIDRVCQFLDPADRAASLEVIEQTA